MSRRKEHREKGEKAKKKETRRPETEAQEALTRPSSLDLEPKGSGGSGVEASTAEEQEEAAGAKEVVEESTPREQELLDSLTRVMADFDNFRKRVRREQTEANHEIQSRLILRILPILDDYDRARGAAGPTEHPADREVLLRILGGLADVLEREGITPIRVEPGDPFDPSVHEAIGTSYSQKVPAQHVLDVFERGYLFNERLLRPARVLVSLGIEVTPESKEESAGKEKPGDEKNHEPDGPDPDG